MSEAFFPILAGGAAGLVVSLVVYGGVALKVWRLQSTLLTVQQAVLGLKGTMAAQARWGRRDALEELRELADQAPKPRQRFANDPLVPE
jgi:hypothetical protein